jgi:hypothetical protein
MSTIFLYEDGHGNVIDEKGGSEPMDYIVDQNEFIVETVATHTEYLGNAVANESSLTCPMLLEKSKMKIFIWRKQNQNENMCVIQFRIKLGFSI